ncbi:MAG: ABC transporter ATP-binding protein [Ferrimicrobium sp.]
MASRDDEVIRLRGVTKRFGSQVAVDAIDLNVPRGSVFGFLGPNGAGKTTTIRMMLGLVFPDSGSVEVLGASGPRGLRSVLPRVGAMVEGPGFVGYLSARENLSRLLAAEGEPRRGRRANIDRALESVGLLAVADRSASRFSLGMKQRLGLAGALLRPRELYLFDEPTNGLDPSGMREMRRVIGQLRDDGSTVLLSTHLLAEAEQICTHVAFMSQGSVVREGSVDEMTDHEISRVVVRAIPDEAALEVLSALGLDLLEHTGEGAFALVCANGLIPELSQRLVEAGCAIHEIRPTRPSLEDLFVTEVGEGFDVR